MENLNSSKIGSFNAEESVSTPVQITTYVNSIISADNIALGSNESGYPDINNKAVGNSIAIGRNSSAENFGVAVGEKAFSNLAFALGPDAYATDNATAIGRYSKATGIGAMQLNGELSSDEVTRLGVNTEPYTLKFYAGNNKNVTIVNSEGKISADTANTANIAETSTKADKIKTIGLINDYVQLSVVNTIPSSAEAVSNTLYFVVES